MSVLDDSDVVLARAEESFPVTYEWLEKNGFENKYGEVFTYRTYVRKIRSYKCYKIELKEVPYHEPGSFSETSWIMDICYSEFDKSVCLAVTRKTVIEALNKFEHVAVR